MLYIARCPYCYGNNLKQCQNSKFECNNCNKDFYTNEINFDILVIDKYNYKN